MPATLESLRSSNKVNSWGTCWNAHDPLLPSDTRRAGLAERKRGQADIVLIVASHFPCCQSGIILTTCLGFIRRLLLSSEDVVLARSRDEATNGHYEGIGNRLLADWSNDFLTWNAGSIVLQSRNSHRTLASRSSKLGEMHKGVANEAWEWSALSAIITPEYHASVRKILPTLGTPHPAQQPCHARNTRLLRARCFLVLVIVAASIEITSVILSQKKRPPTLCERLLSARDGNRQHSNVQKPQCRAARQRLCRHTDEAAGKPPELEVLPRNHPRLSCNSANPGPWLGGSSHHERARCQVLVYRKSRMTTHHP